MAHADDDDRRSSPAGASTVGLHAARRRPLAGRRPARRRPCPRAARRARQMADEPAGQPPGRTSTAGAGRPHGRRPDAGPGRDAADPPDASTGGHAAASTPRPAPPRSRRDRRLAHVAPGAPTPTFDLAAASGLRRQVFGFLPVLGALRRVDQAQLRRALDHRLLLGRAPTRRATSEEGRDGTSTTGWGGWTSSSMTSVINAAHQRGTRVVLTRQRVRLDHRARPTSRRRSSAARRRACNLARQAAAAVRDRGADGINLDFEPLASRLRRRVRGAAQDHAQRAQQGPARLPAHLRHDRATSATTRSRPRWPPGAADAIFIMGYDYRTSGSSTRRLHRPAVRARVRPRRHRPRLHGAGQPVADDPRASRGTAAPGPPTSDDVRSQNPERREVRLQHGRQLRERRGPRARSTAAAGTPSSRARTSSTGARTAPSTYGCVTSWRQVYYDDAASMKRALRAGQRLRPARRRHVGAGLRRRPPGALPRLLRVVPRGQVRAPGRASGCSPAAQGDEGFVVTLGGHGRERASLSYDVQVSDRRRRLDDLADRDAGDLRRLARRATGTATRSASAPRTARATPAPGTSRPPGTPTPSLAVGRVRARGHGRPLLPHRPGHGCRAGSARCDAGTIVAVTRGPGRRRTATPGTRSPSRSAEWRPSRSWSAASGSPSQLVHGHLRHRRTAPPTAPRVDAGCAAWTSGPGATTGVGTARRSWRPRVLAQRRRLRGRAAAPLDQHRRAGQPRRSRSTGTDGTLVGIARPSRTAPPAPRPGTGTAVGGRRASRTAGTCSSWSGTAAGRTYRAPSARPATAAQVAALRRHRRHRAPRRSRRPRRRTTLISPNGDGVRDSDAARARRDRRDALGRRVIATPRGTVVRTAAAPAARRLHLARHRRRAARACPTGATRRSLGRARRRRQPAPTRAGRHRRHHGARRAPTASPPRLLARTATAPPTRRPRAGRANEKATGTARISGHDARPLLDGHARSPTWAATWNGRDGRRAGASRDGRYTFTRRR